MPKTSPAPKSPVRNKVVAALVALAIAVTASACLITPGQTSVRDAMNSSRVAHSLRALPDHPDLNAKAQAWAEQLARSNSLTHSNVRSGAPGCWTALGENVGYGPDPASIEQAYMRSTDHRANILNGRWDYVGVGYATRGNRVFTVQVFMEGCR